MGEKTSAPTCRLSSWLPSWGGCREIASLGADLVSDAEANLSEAEKSSISSHSRLHFVFSSMKVMEWILEGSIQIDKEAFAF